MKQLETIIITALLSVVLFGCSPISSSKINPPEAFLINPSKSLLISYAVVDKEQSGSIQTGNQPVGIVISPDGLSAYVIDKGSHEIQHFSTFGLKLRANIHLPGPPIAFTIDSTKGSENGYALLQDSSNLYEINILNNHLVASFPVGVDPTSITINPTNDNAYVTDAYTNTLDIVDLLTKTVKYRIPVGQEPIYSILSPNKTIVYVVCKASGEVVPVSLLSLKPQSPIPVAPGPFKMIINYSLDVGYVASSVLPEISVINLVTNQIEPPLSLGGIPTDIEITHDDYLLYITERNPSQFIVQRVNGLTPLYSVRLNYVSPSVGVDP